MFFANVYTPGLAHSSYIMGGEGACVVVDPARDVSGYIEQAKRWDRPITAVILTHLHADFVAGHLELAQTTGAKIYAPAAANCVFEHHAVADGQEFTVDSFRFRMLLTPGHTPEGAVFVVSDLSRGPEPCLVFTGDTLLVGDVGRPDLFPDQKEQLAGDLYKSLGRLGDLPDRLEVYPAHGMGSLCGRQLSAKLWSTLGNERRHNYALRIAGAEEFATALLNEMPEAPDHFARCSEINRRGPTLIADLPEPAALEAAAFAEAVDDGHVVVDTRDQLAFAGAHVPGSFALSLQGNFATFAGWVLPPDRPLLLVLESAADLAPALKGLRRVGLDRVTGYLKGGMTAWVQSGRAAAQVKTITVPELKTEHDQGKLKIVDTRLYKEHLAGHIEGSVHIPAPDLRRAHPALDPGRSTAVICKTGNRSVLAASILKQRGFAAVANVVGGMTAWEAAGYPQVVPSEEGETRG